MDYLSCEKMSVLGRIFWSALVGTFAIPIGIAAHSFIWGGIVFAIIFCLIFWTTKE